MIAFQTIPLYLLHCLLPWGLEGVFLLVAIFRLWRKLFNSQNIKDCPLSEWTYIGSPKIESIEQSDLITVGVTTSLYGMAKGNLVNSSTTVRK